MTRYWKNEINTWELYDKLMDSMNKDPNWQRVSELHRQKLIDEQQEEICESIFKLHRDNLLDEQEKEKRKDLKPKVPKAPRKTTKKAATGTPVIIGDE